MLAKTLIIVNNFEISILLLKYLSIFVLLDTKNKAFKLQPNK